MNITQLKESLKHWDKGQMEHKCQMLQENDHRLTKMIRDGKRGMDEADRIHKLMQEMELVRVAKLEETKKEYQEGVQLCKDAIQYYGKKKVVKPTAPIAEVELPIKEIIKEIEKPKSKKKSVPKPEPEIEEEDEGFLPVKCQICGRPYSEQRYLDRHMNTKHPPEG